MIALSIPSPGTNIWYVGPFPLRAYALCIIAGIIVGMIIATRRWQARGGTADSLEMVVVVAVPCGIVGARIYHVITDYQLYFGPGRHPIDALKIWHGGLGIWGAIAMAALGAYLVARRRKIVFPALLDAVAPGILVAQAIGRIGNWFNQELFGRPTTLPWALEIEPRYRPAGYPSSSPPSTRRSCTNCCGIWPSRWSWCCWTASSGWGTARSSPSTCALLRWAGSGSRPCGSTRSTRSAVSG